MSDNHLYALIEEADSHRTAAVENQEAVKKAIGELQAMLIRMESVAGKMEKAPDGIGAKIKEVTIAVFQPSLTKLTDDVERKVYNSTTRLNNAAERASTRFLPWTKLLAAFLLGATSMGFFGYFDIKAPLEETFRAQATLYGELTKLEAKQSKGAGTLNGTKQRAQQKVVAPQPSADDLP